MNVLVVEDDVDVAQVIVDHVERWGHDAEISATGKQALEKARQRNFDLALIDIFLPDTKGYDLIPRLKEVRPDMWFVSITGYNTRELELKVREQRVAYFMTKPFEPFALKAVIDHMEKKKNPSL